MGFPLLLVTGSISSAKSLLTAVEVFDPERPGPSIPEGQGSSLSFSPIFSIGLPGVIFLLRNISFFPFVQYQFPDFLVGL